MRAAVKGRGTKSLTLTIAWLGQLPRAANPHGPEHQAEAGAPAQR
jgi:hypothetical protein